MAVAHRPSALHIGSLMKPVKFVLMLPVTFIGLLVVTLIFTVLNKAFWDARVRYLCANEGGVTVYETVDLSAPEYASIPKDVNGVPFISVQRYMNPGDPFYRTSARTSEEKWGGVTIAKFVENIVRASNNKILGKRISYNRSGGDFIDIGGAGTIYSCNSITSPFEFSTRIFNLQGVD